MDEAAAAAACTEPTETRDEAPIASIWSSGLAVLSQWVALLAAEGRLAGLSVARMLVYAVASGFVLAGAWGLLVAALAVWFVALGYNVVAVLLVFALLHLALAVGLWIFIVHLSRHLLFPATRESLMSVLPRHAHDDVPGTPTA